MTIETATGGEEDLKQYKGPQGIALRWQKEIENVETSKMQRGFEWNGEKIVKNYRNADALQQYGAANSNATSTTRVMINVLWSNVKILKPTYFCRLPKVIAERVFKDSDPVGRVAARLLERATHYSLKSQEDRAMFAIKAAVEDRLLPGRGQIWLRYDIQFEESKDANGEPMVDADGNTLRIPKPNSEKVIIDPINWLDYLESISRNQYEVRWRCRKLYMSRAELIREFGPDIGKKVPLDYSPGDRKKKLSNDEEEFIKQAQIYLICDKASETFYWISKSYKEGPCKTAKDPLRLKEFFPCPRPLLATTTTDSTYPTPDFKIYERLADEADYVAKRLSAMVECIRFVGATSAAFNTDIKNVLKLSDGQLWPVEGWGNWVEKGGFAGIMDWLPFDKAVEAIGPLTQYLQQLLSQIDLITGIPDIVRGVSDPAETAAAQQHKSHWIMVKIQEDQAEVQRFCREIVSKIAEIIFEPGLFSDETIALMAGVAQMSPDEQQLIPEALALLRDDRLRSFRVDIETDSTIAEDDDDAMLEWQQYMQAIQGLVGELETVSQYRPELVYPMVESAKAASRVLRTGNALEGCWEKAFDEMLANDKAAKENPPPPPPDYEAQKIQVMQEDLQMRGQIAQGDQALKAQEIQNKMAYEQFKLELDSKKVEIDGMKVQSKAQVDAMAQELEDWKLKFQANVEMQRLELEKFATVMQEKDRALQEARLQADERLQLMQIHHDHKIAVHEANLASRESEVAKPKEEPKPTVVHIHNGSGAKKVHVKRQPDGSMVGKVEPENQSEDIAEGGIEE